MFESVVVHSRSVSVPQHHLHHPVHQRAGHADRGQPRLPADSAGCRGRQQAAVHHPRPLHGMAHVSIPHTLPTSKLVVLILTISLTSF